MRISLCLLALVAWGQGGNGDGQMDVAFVDRPHLAKTLLAVWLVNGKLTPRKLGRYLGPKTLAAALGCSP